MNLFALLIAATIPAAAPAKAPQAIAIHPGETLTVQFEGRTPVVVQRGPAAPISAFETGMVRHLQRQEVPAGAGVQPAITVSKDEVAAEPPVPTPDRVQITFRRIPGLRPGSEDHSLLFLVNGFGSSFRYRAVMHVGDRAVPTDVCEVRSNLSSSEHWPYVIDQIDLTSAWLEAPEPGNIRCE